MKIAIHHREGSFSDRWITYCQRENIPYKIVDCFQSDIIMQLCDCDALMWHHHHSAYKDVLVAKNILFALEHAGIKVFPDFRTSWHFDNKVAQKYLLEAVHAPLVPSYVFYSKDEALSWVKTVDFPKVFKLRGGAGAANVKLIKSRRKAIKLVHRAFKKGFPQFDQYGNLKEKYNKFRLGKETFLGLLKGVARLFIKTQYAKMHSNEIGYVYFQEFIPNNDYDIRVIVIGEKAFAIKRKVRKNDFRASGSGNVLFNKEDINVECIKIAFDLNQKIGSQSIAYDFVFDEGKCPLVVEISYGFAVSFYDFCPGYWDVNLCWNEGKFNPQEWMVEELIKEIQLDASKS